MKSTQKKPAQTPNLQPRSARHISTEDERDVRDAERAIEEAKEKGVIPWDWLKREIRK